MKTVQRNAEIAYEGHTRSRVDLLLRALTPTDATEYGVLLEEMSAGLLGLQLFPEAPRAEEHDLTYLTDVDFHLQGAFVAMVRLGEWQVPVGIGRWVRATDTPTAGIAAVAVHEDWRNQGIGDTLLALVVQSATDSGITLLRVPVWVSASVLRGPLLRLGATFTNWSGGRSEGDLPLPANADALIDLHRRVALRELVRAG